MAWIARTGASMKQLNFRIGTKLAISAVVGVALVVAILANQQLSGSAVMQATDTAIRQQTTQAEALAAQSAIRGLELANRDVRSAVSPTEVDSALTALRARLSETDSRLDAATVLTDQPEQRERLANAKQRSADYAAA